MESIVLTDRVQSRWDARPAARRGMVRLMAAWIIAAHGGVDHRRVGPGQAFVVARGDGDASSDPGHPPGRGGLPRFRPRGAETPKSAGGASGTETISRGSAPAIMAPSRTAASRDASIPATVPELRSVTTDSPGGPGWKFDRAPGRRAGRTGPDRRGTSGAREDRGPPRLHRAHRRRPRTVRPDRVGRRHPRRRRPLLPVAPRRWTL